jgi:hypothetical protein
LNPEEEAKEVVKIYGKGAYRLLRYVIGKGGYLNRVNKALEECVSKQTHLHIKYCCVNT